MPSDATRILVHCDSCGKAYSLKPELAGKKAQCSCGARMIIPAHSAAAPSPVTAAASLVTSAASTAPPPAPPPPAFVEEEEYAEVWLVEPPEDDGFELEPPVQRTFPDSLRHPVQTPKVGPASPPPAGPRSRGSASSAALKFVGVYGFVIMGAAALIGVINVIGSIFIALRPEVTLGTAAVLFGIVAIQSCVFFVIFRLGRGLIDSERSAVQGLLVLYVLAVALAALGAFAWPEYLTMVLIAAGVTTLVIVPPLIVAYLNWHDFHGAED